MQVGLSQTWAPEKQQRKSWRLCRILLPTPREARGMGILLIAATPGAAQGDLRFAGLNYALNARIGARAL
jgi:hypothetical protein